MEFRDFLNLSWQKRGVVLSIVLVFLALAAVFVVIMPLKHEANSRLLIVQDFAEGTSSYNMSQSNNYLSKLLSGVVDSSSFFRDVLNSGYNIDRAYFSTSGDDQEMIREWRRTVEASTINDGGGIIEISVYHTEKDQLEQISEAVNYILRTNHSEYHSLDKKVGIRVIDDPVISRFPVKPNVSYIFFLALVLGLTIAGSYVYLFSESKDRDNSDSDDHHSSQPASYPEYEDRGSSRFNEEKIETEDDPIPIRKEDPEDYLVLDRNKEDTYSQGIGSGPAQGDRENEGGNQEKDDFQKREQEENITPEEIEKRGDIRNIFG